MNRYIFIFVFTIDKLIFQIYVLIKREMENIFILTYISAIIFELDFLLQIMLALPQRVFF